jgi:hypothetical protein
MLEKLFNEFVYGFMFGSGFIVAAVVFKAVFGVGI